MVYEVVVGNIGTVYRGEDVHEAQRMWREYRILSAQDRGRGAGEDVTMLGDGEIVEEYRGSIGRAEDLAGRLAALSSHEALLLGDAIAKIIAVWEHEVAGHYLAERVNEARELVEAIFFSEIDQIDFEQLLADNDTEE